ncbi:MAG: hypothetical protein IT496_01630 [Gammaproteobacteria bacterium]|nr:hypothetical protein [Gammaproteobacteria bacterium]
MVTYELARRNARGHLATMRSLRCIRRAVTEEDIDRHMLNLASMGHLPEWLFIELQADIRRRKSASITLVSAETD